MATIVLNGSGSHVRVTTKGAKPTKVTVVANSKVSQVTLSKSTDLKFAA